MIVWLLNAATKTCRHRDSQRRRCQLPYGHAIGHRWRPTLREWVAGWAHQGREGPE